MGGKCRHIAGWTAALAAACAGTAQAEPVAAVPPDNADGFGYRQPYWPEMTAALDADSSTPIVSIPDLSNLSQLMGYGGLWVDDRFSGGLTTAEAANLQAYIATGRRVVLVGSNYNYGTWDSSILNALGGSFNNSSSNYVTGVIPQNTEPTIMTAGITSLVAASASDATLGTNAGAKLFDQPVVTLWGPAKNALVILDSAAFSSSFRATDYFTANTVFAHNVAAWVNGNLSQGIFQWNGSASAAWNTGSCWNTKSMPSSGDDAAFTAGSTGQTITISSPMTCRNLNLSSTQITLDMPASGGLTAFGALTVTGGSTLSLTRSTGTSTATVSAASVNVAAGSTLSIGSGMVVSSANISGGVTVTGYTGHWSGTLDITTGSADLTGVNLATVTDQIRQGFNYTGGGNWIGDGITSSTAAADTSHLHAVGVMAGINSDVIARYTLFGDANLDGKVDGSDYTLIDAGYASGGKLTGWLNGDFNYDGVIDGSDYALIDNVFHNQPAATSAEPAALTSQIAAVPEPIGIAAIASFVAACTRRRQPVGDIRIPV